MLHVFAQCCPERGMAMNKGCVLRCARDRPLCGDGRQRLVWAFWSLCVDNLGCEQDPQARGACQTAPTLAQPPLAPAVYPVRGVARTWYQSRIEEPHSRTWFPEILWQIQKVEVASRGRVPGGKATPCKTVWLHDVVLERKTFQLTPAK